MDDDELDSVTLEKFKFGLSSIMSKEMIVDGVMIEPWFDRLRVNVHGYVWSDPDRIHTLKAQWPKDWWEAFKERWFPAWAKKRWPVLYSYSNIESRYLYPELRPQLNNTPRALHWEQFTWSD